MEIEENVCEERTYDRIYRSLAPSLRNFIYYKCGDSDLSSDLTQEAFIRLWKNCSKVPLSKAKSFLYTVAKNLFLNDVAHNKVVLNYKQHTSNRVDTISPEFILEEKEYKAKLQNAIDNLSEAQRTAFLLNRIEGKKYREIAIILDISEKAVGKRIHDALATLRKDIENI